MCEVVKCGLWKHPGEGITLYKIYVYTFLNELLCSDVKCDLATTGVAPNQRLVLDCVMCIEKLAGSLEHAVHKPKHVWHDKILH